MRLSTETLETIAKAKSLSDAAMKAWEEASDLVKPIVVEACERADKDELVELLITIPISFWRAEIRGCLKRLQNPSI